MTRRRSLACRLLALAVAVISVEAQIASAVHLATARHVRCAEHDELIDVDSSAPPPARAQLTDAVPTPAGHEHHHCDFVAVGHARALLAASITLSCVRLAQAPATPLIPAELPPAARTPIFRLAPKTSPPT
jgi:hypothetical protein